MISYTAMPVLLALVVSPLFRFGLWRRRIALGVIMGFLLLDLRVTPIRWFIRDTETAPVYDWLTTLPEQGGILELPIGTRSIDYEYTLAATIHHRKIVNGASGFSTPEYDEIARLTQSLTIDGDGLLELLRRIDVRLVVIHADQLGEQEGPVRELVARATATGALIYVNSFEHQHRGDLVFYVPHGRKPDILDSAVMKAARRTSGSLTGFVERGALPRNSRLTGILDSPHAGETIAGSLQVRGWGISPTGLKRAVVLFENGRRRHEARLGPRKDLDSVFPWFRNVTDRAGFQLTFASRPPGIPRETDVQVELTDFQNRTTRLPQVWITWHDGDAQRPFNEAEMHALLSRVGYDPDTAIARVRTGQLNLDGIEEHFRSERSDESDGDFITGAYEQFLGRQPDASGREKYLRRLGNGSSRAEVLRAITHAPELQNRLYP